MMILATSSVLVALASVVSQVAAYDIQLPILRVGADLVSPKPFPARIAAETAFNIVVSFPMDYRTAAEKAASPPADLTKTFYRTTACLRAEGDASDVPCVSSWQAAEPVSNFNDATELRAEVPAISEKLVVGGRYYITYFSGCSFDAEKFNVCKLAQDCRPCAGDFSGVDFTTDVFEVVPKGAKDDVPDSKVLPSDSAAGVTTAVSSMAAAVVAGAMAVLA